jgi:hypothetical protein
MASLETRELGHPCTADEQLPLSRIRPLRRRTHLDEQPDRLTLTATPYNVTYDEPAARQRAINPPHPEIRIGEPVHALTSRSGRR